ncbi:hypothetical protein [Fodinicurvata fenggangensis]|uniref:hypothetical protein n=1 Tax=Fodinicurvata fenggangensis TaxID=1121830 RepID=UPI0012DF07C0|nr:hypothetical protein [Fodinicurvata fenggangensis]
MSEPNSNRHVTQTPKRRMLSISETATYLGKSETWLRTHEHALKETGFPSRHPYLNAYDKVAVDAWIEASERFKEGSVKDDQSILPGRRRLVEAARHA